MSIYTKTAAGWEELGVSGSSSGGGSTKWGGVTAAPNARKNSYGPDSQGRSWDCYVWDQGPSLGDSSPGIEFPVTLSGGMYRVLVVSGGGHGNFSGGAMKNNGGRITQGVFELPAGDYVARVGGLFRWGISSTNREYRESFLKHVDTGVGVFSGIVSLAGDDNNSSGSFQGWRGNKDDGYLSDIEGQTWEYGANKNPDGVSISSYGAYSSSGAVIIATVDEDKTDYYPPGALPGVGGWATITGIDGTAGTRYQYGDWVAYEWTADGSLTTQAGGLVDVLLVGGGATTHNTQASTGAPGGLTISGIHSCSATNEITVGPVGAQARTTPTTLGAISTKQMMAHWSTATAPTVTEWVTSDITGGPAQNYAMPQQLSARPGKGDGGGKSAYSPGSSGCCIVRVPKAHAYLGALPAGWVDA